ncbi:MAG: TonB-dependent receptor [Bacteroidetes bacterium]|nr:TonB-dependent receptor [Bacteroidota bacterium]
MMKIYQKWGLSLVILLMLACSQSFAQSLRVSGKISDEAGQPVPGASVVEKGTANGTVTDANGDYSLTVSSSTATIAFSFIGYKTQEIAVSGRAVIDVSLQADVTSLQEVIVTGYSSERKQDLVSAVSTIANEKTVSIPVSNVEQAIQGRIAGVIVQTSGQPGAPSQVRVRGFGSLGANSPLFVVDGVPTYDVSNLNPYDIESTTVLKDAGAASIYGSRAAAGVIIYTTKHGKNDGKTRIDFDMSTGLNFPGQGIKMLNPTQQAQKVYEALTNGGGNATGQPYGSNLASPVLPDYINVGVQQPDGSWKPTGNIMSGDPLIQKALDNYNVDPSKGSIVQVVRANKGGTDWYKAMTRVAPVNRYSLGMSGGTDRAHYYANLSYYDQQGLALNTYLKRYNLRVNSEFKPIKQVRIGENLQLSYRENPQIGDQQSENQLNLAYRMPTIIPVYDEKGGWAGTAAPGFNNPANPVASLSRISRAYNLNSNWNIFGNTYMEVDPIPHVTLRTSFGGQMNNYYYLNYSQRTYENAENSGSYQLNEGAGFQMSWVFTNTVRYENKFGNHSVKVFAGTEALKSPAQGRDISGFGLNPFSNDPSYIGVTNTNSVGRTVNSGPQTPRTLASYFGKIDYNWSDKYYLSATIRRDGSSVFGQNNRYGVFPAVSAAWRISSESFMKGVSWIDDLKLRGGWGVMGNQASVPPANQYTLFTTSPSYGYDIAGNNSSVSSAFIPQQVGNPNGQWEQNKTINIGLDGTFMKGTLDVILEVWQKNTDKLLFAPQIPATAGVYLSNPLVNIASMVNKGIDLQVIKRVKVNNEWSLIFDGNIAPISNQITALAPGNTYFDAGNFRNLNFVRNAVGQSISSFYGYKVAGYFNSDAEATAANQDQAAAGRFKYVDTNKDGKIDASDRVFMGSPVPKFTYGLNVTVKYKNWSLDAFVYGKSGNKIINFSKWYTGFYQSFSGAGLSALTLDSWTPTHQNAGAPKMETASNFSTNGTGNSWYMENGSYMRLKNLQLNYTVPTSFLSKYNIRSLKVYMQAVNLFTITKYTGKDPEVASSVDTTLGVDVGNYPATRIWSLGVNLGF